MTKKILYTKFETAGDVLSSVLKNTDLQAGIKKTTISKFWGKVVGKKFEEISKPVSLSTQGVLTVACANSYVTSELLMFKPDILKKLAPYAKSLDIVISDINFSHKIWSNERDLMEEYDYEEKKAPKIPEIDYDSIELDPAEVENIEKCVRNNKFASEEQRGRMFEAIVKDLKFQKAMESGRFKIN